MDPTTRFDDRVDFYARYRPSYPSAAVDLLMERLALHAGDAVAEVGSGTGILTALLLDRGLRVAAIEPNTPMRHAAETRLGERPSFTSIAGTAEETALADASVRSVIAAQAFHWFDVPRCRREFTRILEPDGRVALLWNRRPVDTDFDRAYEAFVRECSRDYDAVTHRRLDRPAVESFFVDESCQQHTVPNPEALTFDELRGRLLSASYMPLAGEPGHDVAMQRLRELFDAHAENGRVVLAYSTEIYWGRVA